MNHYEFMTIDYFSSFDKSCLLSQVANSQSNSSLPNISEIIKDPLWTPLSVLVAFIGIGVTVLIALSQQKRRDFSYYITSNENILSVSDDIKVRMAITFDNKPIKNLNLIVVRFKNTGNVSITTKDYEYPIGISFGENSVVLSAEVINQEPKNLNVTVKNNPLNQSTSTLKCDYVSVNPLMLNSGDFYELKILVSEFKKVNVDARIVEVKKIRKIDNSNKKTGEINKFFSIVILQLGSPIVFLLFALASIYTSQPFISVSLYAIIMTLIIIKILDIKIIDIFKKK